MKRLSSFYPALITAGVFSILKASNLFFMSGRGAVHGLADLVIKNGITGTPFSAGTAISIILDALLPVLIIELIYGSYIYKLFCNVGIYYFSRQYSRCSWFLRKCMELYLIIFGYTTIEIGLEILFFSVIRGISFNFAGLYCLLYYLLHWSLWLFAVTLLINVISLKLTSSGGFMAVFIGQIFCLGAYVLASPTGIVSSFSWGTTFTNAVIHLNPMSHVILALQKSSNGEIQSIISEALLHENYPLINFNFSIVYLVIMCLFVIMIGNRIVMKFEFFSSNFENGGN